MPALIPATLVLPGEITAMPTEDWALYQREGEQYLAVAERAFVKQRKAFTVEILYNLIAMAMEKLVMAALMRVGRLPDNHTLGDLAQALARWLPEASQGLSEEMTALDRFQEICDLEKATLLQPSPADIEAMLALARRLEDRLRPALADH